MNAISIVRGGLFPLGMIVSTPGAIASCSHNHRMICLSRHITGDWGNVCPEDAALNNEAVTLGSRLLSAYPIDATIPSHGFGENTLWVITEADRSMTTFLLPEDY